MKPVFTIAAISDIHVNKYPLKKDFFERANEVADLFVFGGDIGNGKYDEILFFLQLVSGVKIPMIFVFGNHDCDTEDTKRIKEILSTNTLIRVLDGEYVEYHFNNKTVGIAGAKGYGGGFAPHRIVRRGESATKSFMDEEDSEVSKLESALHQMRLSSPDFKIALTHWVAFEEIADGEPKELSIALGSSRLGDAIEQSSVHLALSGHAHHGSKGIKRARGKISACNISYKANGGKLPLFDFFPDESVSLRYPESH